MTCSRVRLPRSMATKPRLSGYLCSSHHHNAVLDALSQTGRKGAGLLHLIDSPVSCRNYCASTFEIPAIDMKSWRRRKRCWQEESWQQAA